MGALAVRGSDSGGRGGGRPDDEAGPGTLAYWRLRKPAFSPPSWLFGPVWTALYGLMSWSAYRIYRKPDSPERTKALRMGSGSSG